MEKKIYSQTIEKISIHKSSIKIFFMVSNGFQKVISFDFSGFHYARSILWSFVLNWSHVKTLYANGLESIRYIFTIQIGERESGNLDKTATLFSVHYGFAFLSAFHHKIMLLAALTNKSTVLDSTLVELYLSGKFYD